MTVLLPGTKPPFLQSIANASVRTNFYTGIDNAGQSTDSAEKAFAALEAEASTAWREVWEGAWPLASPDREMMAGWIALHLLRGSATRTRLSQLGTQITQLEIIIGGRARLREALRESGEPFDDVSVTKEWIDLFRDPLTLEVQVNAHLHHIARILPRVTEGLLDRWWLLTTFQRKGLATSDHPVFVVPNEQHRALGLGTGIENADVIHVPLTRRHSLALALRSTLPSELARRRDDGQVPGSSATALYSNSCTVNSARQALFHHPADTPLAGLQLPQPRTREIGSLGDVWRFMSADDRQVLIDAGIASPAEVSGQFKSTDEGG